MWCQSCAAEVNPFVEMTVGGTTITKCPGCHARLDAGNVVQLHSVPAPAEDAPLSVAPPASTADTLRTAAQARLEWIRGALSDVDALRAEARQLAAMLAAKPRTRRKKGTP